MKINIKSCWFVEGTNLVPKKWAKWFWEGFSSNAPFSYGDNNRTMITLDRFADHAEETFGADGIKGFDEWIKEIRTLKNENDMLYVDIEN